MDGETVEVEGTWVQAVAVPVCSRSRSGREGLGGWAEGQGQGAWEAWGAHGPWCLWVMLLQVGGGGGGRQQVPLQRPLPSLEDFPLSFPAKSFLP